MRVLVCGGRDYEDREAVFEALDALHRATPIEVVIEGGYTGADRLAASWARVREVSSWRVPAQWSKQGRNAGPLRNARMLAMCAPDLVLAFPGHDGTADMIAQAGDVGVKVRSSIEAVTDPRQVTLFEALGAA